ncbi:MAG TPA: hypothetical protein VK689_09715 [Armatimonadota bacterium]|nr:hypothetical protein [Armatimonadota bacterium]
MLSALATVLAAAAPAPARAHPADEASVFHYLWLEAGPGSLSLQHATVVGGLLTQAVWPTIDRDGDRILSAEEQQRYARELAASISLKVDGKPVRWKLEDALYPSRGDFFGGELAAVKLRLTAPLGSVSARGSTISVRDDTYVLFKAIFPQPVVRPTTLAAGEPRVSENGRLMEVTLTPGGVTAPQIGAPGTPEERGQRSRLPGLELTPKSVAEAPDMRKLDEIDLRNAPLFPERGKIVYAAPQRREGAEVGKLKGFLGRPLSLGLVLLGLGAALLAGMAHALTPGHGKAMVAAYLVGSRGTVWDAVFLGIVVTVTHTAGVYVLGFLCLWLTSQIQAEVVAHWLSLLSGLLVLGMGFWLFQRGLLAYHGVRPLPGHGHLHTGAEHDGAHGHTHLHTHDQAHSHGDGGAAPGVESASVTGGARRPPHDAPLDEEAGAPPGETGVTAKRPERWGLIGLGAAGGIVPCFDALAILIAAVNLGSVAVGLALIAAFSAGMAAVLVVIGILLVRAKSLMSRFTGESRWVQALPAVSGAVLFFLGAWLTLQALAAAGIVRIG